MRRPGDTTLVLIGGILLAITGIVLSAIAVVGDVGLEAALLAVGGALLTSAIVATVFGFFETTAAARQERLTMSLASSYEGADLRGRDLSGFSLSGKSFVFAKVAGANFDGADLRFADFRGAECQGASFRNANLWQADFRSAQTIKPDEFANPRRTGSLKLDVRALTEAFQRGREGGLLSGASFNGALLSSAHFDDITIKDVSFEGAQLDVTSFAGASFIGATSFRRAFLYATDFADSRGLDRSASLFEGSTFQALSDASRLRLPAEISGLVKDDGRYEVPTQ